MPMVTLSTVAWKRQDAKMEAVYGVTHCALSYWTISYMATRLKALRVTTMYMMLYSWQAGMARQLSWTEILSLLAIFFRLGFWSNAVGWPGTWVRCSSKEFPSRLTLNNQTLNECHLSKNSTIKPLMKAASQNLCKSPETQGAARLLLDLSRFTALTDLSLLHLDI